MSAARLGDDDDDLRLPASMLGLETSAAMLDLAVSTIGEGRMTPRAQFFVEQVMAGG